MIYCKTSNQNRYPFKLPDLAFDKTAFMPHISSEAFDLHHGKHHNSYVINLNKLLENDHEMAAMTLEEVIMASYGKSPKIFNNAAQIWNHSFYWNSIAPNVDRTPGPKMLVAIEQAFGSYDDFVKEFTNIAAAQFGSGWAWLVYDDMLKIITTSNANTPITDGVVPLMTCDVWEHAYYVDYRNRRPDYLSGFFKHMINWDFVEENFNNLISNQ